MAPPDLKVNAAAPASSHSPVASCVLAAPHPIPPLTKACGTSVSWLGLVAAGLVDRVAGSSREVYAPIEEVWTLGIFAAGHTVGLWRETAGGGACAHSSPTGGSFGP